MTIEVYTVLVERLKSEVAGLRWVDWWNNQVGNEENEYPILYPACFLHLKETVSTQLAGGWTQEDGTLSILVCQQNFLDHYVSEYQTTVNANALQILNFKKEVVRALDNFSVENLLMLQKKAERVDADFTNLYVHEIDFAITYYDDSKVNKNWITKMVDLEVNKEYVSK